TPTTNEATAAAIIASPNHNRILRNSLRIYPKRLLRLVTGVDVTNAADGLDSLNAMHLVAKFFSQVTNVRVDAAIERRQFAMQHVLDQLFAGQDTARGIQQF